MENLDLSKPVRPARLAGAWKWIIMASAGTILIIAGLWATIGSQAARDRQPDAISQAAFEEATGVRIVRVALTAGGGMIDLRYLVIDPEKALIIHSEDNPPAIVDEATGTTFNSPWMNHSHSGEYQAGVTYYTLLMNSGGVLSRGSQVTVILGGVRLEHLMVQ